MLGISGEWRLVTVTASAGTLRTMCEDEITFSFDRFQAWEEEYPYRYGVDEDTFNLFYTSTEGLGLSDLPKGRILVVCDTRLQSLPPNLFRVGEHFAGQSRPIAAVPSLSWLAAARRDPARTNSCLSAWIPVAGNNEGTLAMIADRLQPTFHDYGFYFDGGLELPAGVAKAEIAVIAAHGSIVPEGRYFQLISDDSGLRVPASDLARKLRNTGVVILFVCSGGRADKHPASNTTVGLAKQLLDRGCSAVIASPWPLDARVTYHWLPEFLRCWTLGQPVIDASFSANEAVAAALGDDPARCLAMSVYGDGLRMKSAP